MLKYGCEYEIVGYNDDSPDGLDQTGSNAQDQIWLIDFTAMFATGL